MSASIVHAIARIKRDVAEFLTAASIVQACRDVHHTWRERELGPTEQEGGQSRTDRHAHGISSGMETESADVFDQGPRGHRGVAR